MDKGTKVVNRDGTATGVLTGGRYKCRMEGCNGHRVAVKWDDDGKVTHPCTKGMTFEGGQWKIV